MPTAKCSMLDARRANIEGVWLLPSEVSRIRYEDLRTILLDYYREHKPHSIIKRYAGDTDSAGNKLTEGVLAGAEITALKIKDYVKWRRKEGDADPTIRRQLGNLRSAFTQAKALDLITDSHIRRSCCQPTQNLEKDFSIFKNSILFATLRPKNCDPRLRSCTSAGVDQELRRKLHGR
jgi:hypothetical protein